MKFKEQCANGWLDTTADWGSADFEDAQKICRTCPLYATDELGSCPGIQNLELEASR
jgi:hypothetical protein